MRQSSSSETTLERLRAVCDPYGVRVVENPDWRQGQSTSVRAGLLALGPEVRAAVVLLGDQPLVGPRAVERLVAAFEEGAEVVVATYGGSGATPCCSPGRCGRCWRRSSRGTRARERSCGAILTW